MTDFVEFPIEFTSEIDNYSPEIREEVENRLLDLAKGHTDLVGAAIAITQPSRPTQDETPFVYQTRILMYARPENIVAAKQDDTITGSMKAAMSAIERQVREKREKLGEPWKRTDIPGTPSSNPDLEV